MTAPQLHTPMAENPPTLPEAAILLRAVLAHPTITPCDCAQPSCLTARITSFLQRANLALEPAPRMPK